MMPDEINDSEDILQEDNSGASSDEPSDYADEVEDD